MLIRFNIKNFLSFSARENGDAEEFSMIAGKPDNKKEHILDDGNLQLLKFAAIYGANAAGKSNLVKALNFMRHTILTGLPRGHTELYSKTHLENKNRNSYFEVEIKIKDKYYAYGFEVLLTKGKFVSEWLVELCPSGEEYKIFERNIPDKSIQFGENIRKDEELNIRLNVYSEDVQENDDTLFLSYMNTNKSNLYARYPAIGALNDVYRWIENSLDINYPDRPISGYSYFANTNSMAEICKMISSFGTGIKNYKIVDIPIERALENMPDVVREDILSEMENTIKQLEEQDMQGKKVKAMGVTIRNRDDLFIMHVNAKNKDKISFECKTIRFNHGDDSILFTLGEESDGTIRLLDLLEILIAGSEKTYVVDELDRCLHPCLTYRFVELFLQVAQKKNIQLIVTTHESRLLDFDLLRKDEVWFINKNDAGSSSIYSLDEYNDRFDKKIDKAYLDGRYGGVPIFNTVFPINGGLK